MPRRPSHPPIALLTDFGVADAYVGTLKGVLRARRFAGDIIDLSHEVLPQAAREAAFLLWSSYRHFPSGTLFVCVVDPGVGTARAILACRTRRFRFLAPANGLLDLVLQDEPRAECVAVGPEALRRFGAEEVSATFHGRDLFAPLAAAVAGGRALSSLGPRIERPAQTFGTIMSPAEPIAPVILHVDRFGNLVTNVRAVEGVTRDRCSVRIRGTWVRTWARTYAEMPDRTVCLVAGSSGLIEASVRNGSAARHLNAGLDAHVEVRWK